MYRPVSGRTRLSGLVGCFLVSMALLISAPAGAWTIDFEDSFLDLPNPVVSRKQQGRIVDDEFSSAGLIGPAATDYDPTLSANFSGFRTNGNDNPLVLFDSNNPTGHDYDLAAPFYHADTNQALNPGHILILHENSSKCRNAWGSKVDGTSSSAVSCDNPDDRDDGGMFVIEFNKGITLQSIDFFDIETAEGSQGPDSEILLFDVNGDQILSSGPFYTPSTGGDNKWKELAFNVVGVAKIKINCTGSCAIDNITGTGDAPPPDPGTQVPEPPALLIFAAGLMALGLYRRRRA